MGPGVRLFQIRDRNWLSKTAIAFITDIIQDEAEDVLEQRTLGPGGIGRRVRQNL